MSEAPETVLKRAFAAHEKIAVAFSGAEDVAVVDMARKVNPDVAVFTLDTGRLHPETYKYIDKVRRLLEVNVEVLFPDAAAVQTLVNAKGLFSFYEDGHQECCGLRKVAPLRKKLSTLTAWVTGQRRDQNPETRGALAVEEEDTAFGLTKYNPIAEWTREQVWAYLEEQQLPVNELHERGFVSIGCAPCTRPILPGDHERDGRWWWEQTDRKECGLHVINLVNDPLDRQPTDAPDDGDS